VLCCQKVLTGLGSDDFGPASDSEAFEELTGVLAGLFDLGDLLGSDRAEVRMGGHVGYVVGEVKRSMFHWMKARRIERCLDKPGAPNSASASLSQILWSCLKTESLKNSSAKARIELFSPSLDQADLKAGEV